MMTVVQFHTLQEVEEAMTDFLLRLRAGLDLSPVTDRVQDRARQRACKLGYAEYTRRGPNRGWVITDAGRRLLDKVDSAR
jgi:hypothetical protein